MANTMEIWGLNEVNDLLNRLPESVQYKFVQDTYTEILKDGFVKEAKRRVPVGTVDVKSNQYDSRTHTKGNLKRSLGTIKGSNRRSPTVFGGVRSKKVFKKGGAVNDGWYAHMIEFGHKDRAGNMVSPQPFLRPAWDVQKNITIRDIGLAFGKQITRYAKRMTKKMTKTL